jgi:hypothetical protein
MKHTWTFLVISPAYIIHILHKKGSATRRKSGAATAFALEWASKLIIQRGHRDGRNVQKK